MPQPLSALPNNALVKDPTSTYYGQPIIWRKAATNHPGYPANSVTLITNRIIDILFFDAKEPGNADTNRANWGNNRYRSSNLRQFLNSLGAANSWWTAQNPSDGTTNTNNRDATPNAAGSNDPSYGFYDNRPGFLNNLSANFRNAILDTTLPGVVRNTVTDGGGTDTGLTDKIFLASTTEVGLANEGGTAEGTVLPIFSDNASRQTMPTQQAVDNTAYTAGSFSATQNWWWWLRTPDASNSSYVRGVDTTGTLSLNNACSGIRGVRPLCNLKSDILVSDTTDADGAFTIQWVQPPTVPGTLNVPGTILAGGSPAISWTASTDQNTPAQAVSYILERATNGGGFVQIYSGSALSFTDSVAAGTTTVQYRVRAQNTSGVASANNTGSVVNVINNSPPTITGSDGDLGNQTGPFSQGYTVTDPDVGDTITVTERLNGVQIRQYTATSGQAQTLQVTQAMFLAIGGGTQTLTVTASDQHNATATRTWTFTRDITQTSQIQVSLDAPLVASAQPQRVLVVVNRQIPAGASFQVLVCNNGNDASPTWEDATAAVTSGMIYTFTNTTKTAADWGVNVQVNVNRNGATGPCFISSIGGNFD